MNENPHTHRLITTEASYIWHANIDRIHATTFLFDNSGDVHSKALRKFQYQQQHRQQQQTTLNKYVQNEN